MDFRKNILITLIVFMHSWCVFGSASVDDLNQLVAKFEGILKDLKKTDTLRPSITLRLADLLTERARLKEVKEVSEGCVKCTAGDADRKKALALYESIRNKPDFSMKEHVFFRIAYINEVLDNSDKAINAYKKIIRNDKLESLHPKAYVALGELFYKKNDFKKSKFYFSKALEFDILNKGFVIYRLAWCNYHIGQTRPAIESLFQLLRFPEVFLLKEDITSKEIDTPFYQEVSRDLATFLAKIDPKDEEIELLYSLSPNDWKIDNMIYLAKELFRLGNTKKSFLIWQKVRPRVSIDIDQLETSIGFSQVFIETQKSKEVAKEINRSLKIWTSIDCDANRQKCIELHKHIRQNIIEWDKSNRSKPPDLSILQVYRAYIKLFHSDITIVGLTAELATRLELFKEAIQYYNRIIEIQSNKLAISELNDEEKEKTESSLENTLLIHIEVAELSKNYAWMQKAYEDYIRLSKKRKKWFEVVYLKAKLFYDQNQYQKAAVALRSVALMKERDSDRDKIIRIQAANLVLDALVLAKDDVGLEKMSVEFSKAFPDQANHFMRIYRTSVLNQAKGASKNPQQAWQLLKDLKLSGASDEEKIKYYKNKIILASQLNLISDEIAMISQILQIKSLSDEDKKFALSRRLYLAELMLDFPNMYKVAKQLDFTNIDLDQKALRLAFFSELAGKDYIEYYNSFLKHSKDSRKKFEVAFRLLYESSNPSLTFQKHKKILFQNPNEIADFLLESYIKDKNKNFMLQTLKRKELRDTIPVKVFIRDVFLKKLEKMTTKITQHQIRKEDQRLIENDLKIRLQMLKNLEQKTSDAIRSKDWLIQVMILSVIKEETQRISNDIVSLPPPSNLNIDETKQYLDLLEVRASSYKKKAISIEDQINNFFKDSNLLKQLKASLIEMKKTVRMISKNHLELLAQKLSKNHQQKIEQILEDVEKEINPDLDIPISYRPENLDDPKIEALRKEIRKDPFNTNKIKQLIILEEERGYKTMVNYLKERRLSMTSSSKINEKE